MIDTGSALERLEAVERSGFASDSDVRWFVGPHGLLAVCAALRQAGSRAAVDGDAFAWLLADLDDRWPARAAIAPSERARSLVAIATDPSAVAAPSVLGGLMPPSDADGLLVARTMAGDLDRWFDEPRLPHRREVAVPFAVSTHASGQVVVFVASFDAVEGVAPDVLEAPFQACDREFADAVRIAAALAGCDRGRYRAVSERTHLPINAIEGRSVSLAAAVALRRLVQADLPAPDPTWVFTGDLDPEGRVRTLLEGARTADYVQKLGACGGRVLLLPAIDESAVAPLLAADAARPELLPVASVGEAEARIDRHLQGQVAYQRAVQGASAPARGAHRRLLGAAAVVVSLIGLLVLGVQFLRLTASPNQTSGLLTELAAPLPVRIDPGANGPVPFDLEPTEVSNRRYALCMDAGACEQPAGQQARSVTSRDETPVTGVDAEQAERFCRFARGQTWGLPTFEQWRAALQHGAPTEWPVTAGWPGQPVDVIAGIVAGDVPAEIMPVARGTDGSGVVDLAGNVAEWTRTTCDDSGHCLDVESVEGQPHRRFRLVGVDFTLAHPDARWLDSGWFDTVFEPLALVFGDTATISVGFRCAERG